MKPLPPPDWLDFNLPNGHCCLVTDDGSPLTVELAQRLTEQGWKVVVLRFPAALLSANASLPVGVGQVVLDDLSEAQLQQRLADITNAAGPPAIFIHLHPIDSVRHETPLAFSKTDAAIVKQIFFLAKALKPSLTEAAQLGRSAFLTVARLDGEFGLGQQHPFSAIAAGLFGLTKTLNFEWRSVFCRALDVSPELATSQIVQRVIEELHDPDRRIAEVAWGSLGRTTLIAG